MSSYYAFLFRSKSNPENVTAKAKPMQKPNPVNLMTPEKSRSLGWQAESRDADGHLVTQHAPFEDDAELAQYVREETERGMTVTIWPKSN